MSHNAPMLMIQKSKNCIMPTGKDTLISDSRKTVKHQPFRQQAPSATCKEEPSPQTRHNYLMQSLLSIYPKPWRPRATAILICLKERLDIITWDKTGEVKLESESIPQSNISDLISDALRARKNFNPTG